MATVETKPITATEFLRWAERPENRDRSWELEKGEVVELPPPGEVHGLVCAWICYLLWEYVLTQRGGKGRVTANDAGLVVERDPDTVRGPDLMLFAESVPLEQANRGYPTATPLLVVEVRSPNDSLPRMLRRANEYLASGVSMVWLADPEDQSITVVQANQLARPLEGADLLRGGDVLPGLERPVADFFHLPGQ